MSSSTLSPVKLCQKSDFRGRSINPLQKIVAIVSIEPGFIKKPAFLM